MSRLLSSIAVLSCLFVAPAFAEDAIATSPAATTTAAATTTESTTTITTTTVTPTGCAAITEACKAAGPNAQSCYDDILAGKTYAGVAPTAESVSACKTEQASKLNSLNAEPAAGTEGQIAPQLNTTAPAQTAQ